MFANTFRMMPGSLRTLAVAAGLVVMAVVVAPGAGQASTDSNIDLSLAQYTERCQQAAANYLYELNKVMDMQDAGADGPRIERHVDLMWAAYDIVVNECGIDVDDWGDDHP